MGQKPRILVVDDEESIRGILAETLSQIGCEVLEVASAEEALKTLGGGSFDLILTDIRMPGLSGIDLLTQVKKMQIEMEVVIMTSSASLDSSLQAIRLGAYDYLLKPFEELEYVERVVQRALDKQALKKENQQLLVSLKQNNEQLTHATQRAAHLLAESKGFHGHFRKLLDAKDREELFTRLIQSLSKFSKGENCFIWLYSPEARSLVPCRAAAMERPISSIQVPEEVAQSPEKLAEWLSRRAYLPELLQSMRAIQPAAAVDLPLLFAGKGYGILVLLNCRSDGLSLQEAAFLEQVALLTAAGLDRFRPADARASSGAPPEMVLKPSTGVSAGFLESQTEKRIAVRDTLTPLFSFDYFLEYLEMEVSRSRRYRHPFTLLMVKVPLSSGSSKDPSINALLQELAGHFQKRIRMTDIATRYENKFFILLPETDHKSAQKVIRALGDEISGYLHSKGKEANGHPPAEYLAMVEYPTDADKVEGLITTLETRFGG